jgi:DNA-directed RNA polymerase subunit RPC12/RpoP
MRELIRKIIRETVKDGKIICDECGWKWDIEEGGNDLYICHECGHDNTPKGKKKSDNFSSDSQ